MNFTNVLPNENPPEKYTINRVEGRFQSKKVRNHGSMEYSPMSKDLLQSENLVNTTQTGMEISLVLRQNG